MKTLIRWMTALLPAVACLTANAIEDRADVDPNDALDPGEVISWKATYSRYRDSLAGPADDINLRGNTSNLTFWLGHYRQGSSFEQSRAGGEFAQPLALGRLVWSAQAATGGFLGASVTWDGRTEKAQGFAPLLGLSRTNLRTYYNLNFDPNDSVLLGLTHTSGWAGTLMAFQIRDNRLNTGQRVTHLVWRKSLPDALRVTVDLFDRSGSEFSAAPVYRGRGASITVDIGDYFVRAGYDPKANYTPGNMARVAVGLRF